MPLNNYWSRTRLDNNIPEKILSQRSFICIRVAISRVEEQDVNTRHTIRGIGGSVQITSLRRDRVGMSALAVRGCAASDIRPNARPRWCGPGGAPEGRLR